MSVGEQEGSVPRPERGSETGSDTGSELEAVARYEVRWGIPSIVVGLLVFFGALAVGVVLYVVGVIPNPSAAQFGTSVLGYGALFALLVVVVRRRGSGSLARDFGLRFRWIDLALGLGAAFVAKIAATAFGVLAQRLAGSTPVQGNFALDADAVWIVLNAVLFATFLGPLVEELFFRGLVLRAVRNSVLRGGRRGGRGRDAADPARLLITGGDAAAGVSSGVGVGAVIAVDTVAGVDRLQRANAVAIGVSAVLFSALHLYESSSWAAAVAIGGSTLVLGLINARLAVSTGRLGASIVAHVLFNGSSVVLLLVAATR